jgi:hypothetical protein
MRTVEICKEKFIGYFITIVVVPYRVISEKTYRRNIHVKDAELNTTDIPGLAGTSLRQIT